MNRELLVLVSGFKKKKEEKKNHKSYILSQVWPNPLLEIKILPDQL